MNTSLRKVKAVVFDWAGTTIDYGCRGPLAVFLELFDKKGIPITVEEASKPMGKLKIEHIRELLQMERIKQEYLRKFNKIPDENTVNEFNNEFEPMLFKILPEYTDLLPYVNETVSQLRGEYNLKIGSTTGYTKQMMNIVAPLVEKKGFKPDFMISSSEVRQGRPHPWMIFENAKHFNISNMEEIIKVGDTIADIKEGNNANCWSIGVVEGSSLLGFTKNQYDQAIKSNLALVDKKKKIVISIYEENNVDFVINSIKNLPDLIDKINENINNGFYPGGRMSIPKQPYKMFTPGPITTSLNVKLPMLTDWGSREDEYMKLVQNVRKETTNLAFNNSKDMNDQYTTIIMQGSGTFGVESCISSVIPKEGKILVLINGQYGDRMAKIAKQIGINCVTLEFEETDTPELIKIENMLKKDKTITHIGHIHSETTTGILNPINEINKLAKKYNKITIVDAISSFGCINIDMIQDNIDFLISCPNKCLQGVPGFSFIIAKKTELEKCRNTIARSFSLDLYSQWEFLEKSKGGFRFTTPTHVIRAYDKGIEELKAEGGICKRFERYSTMQKILQIGMKELNFKPFELGKYQGPIITTFHSPKCKKYDFKKFYDTLKSKKCVIYPGKLTKLDTFRIGTIGHLNVEDVENLLENVKESITWDNTLH